jgi:hypothetical protein
MSAGYIAERVAAMVAEHGETMVLTRPGEVTSVTLKGKAIPGGVEDLGGSAQHQAFRVKITPTELTASDWIDKSPKRGDRLTVGSRARAVRDATALKDGDVVILYELEVSG